MDYLAGIAPKNPIQEESIKSLVETNTKSKELNKKQTKDSEIRSTDDKKLNKSKGDSGENKINFLYRYEEGSAKGSCLKNNFYFKNSHVC